LQISARSDGHCLLINAKTERDVPGKTDGGSGSEGTSVLVIERFESKQYFIDTDDHAIIKPPQMR
jgi:hypothetical protein